jgi:hypothetical protein
VTRPVTYPLHEPRWPASLTVAGVLLLQMVLPAEVSAGPRWLAPGLEICLLGPIVMANPVRLTRETARLRLAALVLVALLATANAVHLVRLIGFLSSGARADPRVLVTSALLIWSTNVATSALALWETDAGGPFARASGQHTPARRPDLLFPQITGVSGWDRETWRPTFVDYAFVAFTVATAFSPTDTLPLSARAKLLFTATASVSMLTVAVVAARAVNVL